MELEEEALEGPVLAAEGIETVAEGRRRRLPADGGEPGAGRTPPHPPRRDHLPPRLQQRVQTPRRRCLHHHLHRPTRPPPPPLLGFRFYVAADRAEYRQKVLGKWGAEQS